jgi:hypothetical protein
MRMRKGGRAVVVVVTAGVAAITLAACGGGGGSSETERVTVTTRGSTTTVAEDPATNVLQLSDMPPGWIELESGQGFGEDEVCAFEIADGLEASAESGFQDPESGQGVGSEVGVTATPADAEDLFEVVETTLSACTDWESPDPSGPIAWQVEPAELEPLGDESVAVQLQTGAGGAELRAVAVYTRVGEYISGVANTRVASEGVTVDDQIAETEQFARIVVDRMGEPAG